VQALAADHGLAVGCPQIMKRELIGACGRWVNYHDSLLPSYRGLEVTAWSLYHGERITGWSFHVINEKVDDGAILVQGALAVVPTSSSMWHLVQKTHAAAAALPRLLDAMVRRDPGRPQVGEARYFSSKDAEAIKTIAEPERLTKAEVRRRLWAFGTLFVRIGGEILPVTRVSDAPAALSFETADGRLFVRRLRFLPVPIYRRLGARLGA
jgi:methionyl-tRNA formyltransferase